MTELQFMNGAEGFITELQFTNGEEGFINVDRYPLGEGRKRRIGRIRLGNGGRFIPAQWQGDKSKYPKVEISTMEMREIAVFMGRLK